LTTTLVGVIEHKDLLHFFPYFRRYLVGNIGKTLKRTRILEAPLPKIQENNRKEGGAF